MQPVASGVNHLLGVLTLPDGRVVRMDRPGSTLLTQGAPFQSDFPGGSYVSDIAPDGQNLKVRYSIVLASGEVIDTPSATVPAGGGTGSVKLPGGGELTVTVDGTHPLTPDEQTFL